ncbi:hypothetical protein P3X46_015812 [Hevea brasiliensis]|uniref:Uncharacterized protein n=1 Tax=Hevea brasiliensis TaxID=3981 RepID=A0ABQ9LZJ6_HEVBR|nr:GDSL esterase/lipase At5g55050-like [Hevea brasiliensis]KAJ9172595.1 hypothetical protein P3X46_015812 [Hevea brasiliensis]
MAQTSTVSSLCFRMLMLAILSLHCAKATPSVPAIFIFGDSTFDVGTNNFLNDSQAKANFPYNGIDFPYSEPTGRFSNGYNSADQIVKQFGYKRSPPSFFSLLNRSFSFKKRILKGVNFASGGSGILDSTGLQAFVIPLREQIEQFSTVRDNITALLGQENTAMMLSKSLFLISVGSNDIFDYQRRSANTSTNLTAQEFLDALREAYQNHLQKLYDLDARKFGIVSIPPIGCCPFQRFIGKTGDCVKELNDLAQSFYNATETTLTKMSSQVVGMKYSLGNAYAMTSDIIDNPFVFGLKEVKQACCGNGNFPCNASASLCPDRQEYLFWDQFHPTEAASRLAALTLLGGELRYVTPMNFSQLVQTN